MTKTSVMKELKDHIDVPMLLLMVLQSCQISLGRNMIFCQIEKHELYRDSVFVVNGFTSSFFHSQINKFGY